MQMKSRSVILLLPFLLLCGCMMHLVDRMTGEDKANEIRKSGRPGTARVLKIWDTGMSVNGNPVVGSSGSCTPRALVSATSVLALAPTVTLTGADMLL